MCWKYLTNNIRIEQLSGSCSRIIDTKSGSSDSSAILLAAQGYVLYHAFRHGGEEGAYLSSWSQDMRLMQKRSDRVNGADKGGRTHNMHGGEGKAGGCYCDES